MARPLSVLVVGAGVGGLAAAARLVHAGLGVQVLEQTDTRDLGRPMDAYLRLHRHVLVPVRHVTAERVLAPTTGRAASPSSTGAPSGSATTLFQIGPFRPPNQDRTVRNLLCVGPSTHPGTGLPTVMLSAELVVERMLREAAALGARLAPPLALVPEAAA